jgi:hypothetical protein
MHGPTVNVWPFGNTTPHGVGFMWSMDPDEAQQLGEALLTAAHEAKEIGDPTD